MICSFIIYLNLYFVANTTKNNLNYCLIFLELINNNY